MDRPPPCRPPPARHLRAAASLLAPVLGLLTAVASAGGEEPPAAPDPREVLARAKEAAGGAAWDGVRVVRTVVEVTAGGLAGTGEVWEDVATGRYSTTFELGPVHGAAGFDGEAVWSRDASGQVHVSDPPEEREQAVNQAFLRCLGHFYPERWPARVTYSREEAEGGRRFHVLSLHPEGGRPFELWLDAETLLAERTVDPGPRETWVHSFSDYRTVEGLEVPFGQRSGNGLEPYEQVSRVVRVEVDPEVPPGTFEVPEPPAAERSTSAAHER